MENVFVVYSKSRGFVSRPSIRLAKSLSAQLSRYGEQHRTFKAKRNGERREVVAKNGIRIKLN